MPSPVGGRQRRGRGPRRRGGAFRVLIAAVLAIALALLLWQLPLLPPPWLALCLLPALAALPPRARAGGALLLAVLAVALLRAGSWHAGLVPAACEGEPVVLRGEVRGLVERRRRDARDYLRLRLRIDAVEPARCAGPRWALLYADASHSLQPGDRLQLAARLRLPWGLRNAGVGSAQSGHFLRGTQAVGSVRSLRPLPGRPGSAAVVDRLRARLSAQLRRQVPGQGGALLAALLVGDRRFLEPGDWTLLRHYGITHLLVISGMHISLVAAVGWLCGSAAGRLLALAGSGPARRWAGAAAALLLAALYAGISGFALPAQRALLMLLPLAALLPAGRSGGGARLLALAVTLLLLWDPRAVLGASFWLSLGAVALLLWAARWQAPQHRRLRRAAALQGYMVLAMLPMSLYWFGAASTLGAALNLVAVPLVTLWSVPLGLAGLAAGPLSEALAGWLWQLSAEPLLWLWRGMEHWQPALAGIGYRYGAAAPAASLLALLGALLWPLPGGAQRALAALALLLPLAVQLARDGPGPGGGLALTVLDVGQGSSVVLRDGPRTLVYDTGAPGVAERALIPWLRRHGVRRIDTLVVSHEDDDHSAGLPALRAAFRIGETWAGSGRFDGARRCRSGAARRFSARVTLRFLSGPLPGDNDNNGSCVLLIDAAGLRALLPGDIDARRERALVAYWGAALRADLLLAGHHGSAGSTSRLWLRHVAPRQLLVSAGRGNRFGHPAAAVLEAAADAGARSWNTARHGQIEIAPGRSGGLRLRHLRHRWRPFWWLWRRPLPGEASRR